MEEWKKGEKHPETPVTVFKNCYQYDQVRRILASRCKKCNQVISSDEAAVKELVFDCGDSGCYCKRSPYSTKVHRVCSVCYDMWHALYNNPDMQKMGYFKDLDEKDAKDRGSDYNRRDRMGL